MISYLFSYSSYSILNPAFPKRTSYYYLYDYTMQCLCLRINRNLVVAATDPPFRPPPNPSTTVKASFTHHVITLFRAQINAIIPFDGPTAAAAPIESALKSIRFPQTPYLSGFDAAGRESYGRNNTITRGLRSNFAYCQTRLYRQNKQLNRRRFSSVFRRLTGGVLIDARAKFGRDFRCRISGVV